MNDFKDFIQSLSDLTVHNFSVLLGISFVAIKLLLIRLSGHRKDEWRAILLIPEDLVYAALGFILAGLSGAINSFDVYFKSSEHPRVSVWMLFFIGIAICFLIHLIHQHLTHPNYEGWIAADRVLDGDLTEHEGKKIAGLGPGKTDFAKVYFWKFGFFILFFSIECAISLWFLSHIGEIINDH